MAASTARWSSRTITAASADQTGGPSCSRSNWRRFRERSTLRAPFKTAERRYAGVTHIDVTDLSLDAIEKIQDLLAIHQVSISGLGYYPNPLSAERAEAVVAVNHLHRVIDAAAALGVGQVNSFVGRDPALSEGQMRVASWL